MQTKRQKDNYRKMVEKLNPVTRKIREEMKRQGLSERQLSIKSDILNQTLNNTLKAPKAWVQAKHLYKISKVLNRPMEYFLENE
jgi:transcriptional regulator with XRE-family HTH domain